MVAKARLRPMRGLKAAPRIRRVNLGARVAAASPPDTATTPLSKPPPPNSCQSPSTISPSSSRNVAGQPIPAGPAWSTFGPHATGAERFLTVSSGTPFAQVAEAILGKQGRAQNRDKDEVTWPMIDVAAPGRSGPSSARPSRRRAPVAPGLQGAVAVVAQPRHCRAGRPDRPWRADCCRFAARGGDSWAVERGEGL
jgi:hypothetical protein